MSEAAAAQLPGTSGLPRSRRSAWRCRTSTPPSCAGHLALAALEQEWIDAAYGIREPQVAQVKLNWWAEELAGAAASGGRHPLTQALFAAPRADEIELALWLAPLRGRHGAAGGSHAGGFRRAAGHAQRPSTARMARLETRWWYGADADPARAEAHAVIDHLLHALAVLDARHEHERLALPMARMARHGLDRAALAGDSAARRAAVREQLRGHRRPAAPGARGCVAR